MRSCPLPPSPRVQSLSYVTDMNSPAKIHCRIGITSALILLSVTALPAQLPASASPFEGRRGAAIERLGSRLLLVPSRESFKGDDQAVFKQATDFEYFTGLSDLVGAVLAIDGEERQSVLFLPPSNPLITRPRVPFGETGARALALADVQPVDSLASWLARRASQRSAIVVSPNDARGTVQSPLPMAGTVARWASYLHSLGIGAQVSSALPVTRALREVKDAGEIATLQRVAEASGRAMLAGMRALTPGRRQRMVEAEVIRSCIRDGGVHSFWPWAMSGPHGVYTDLWNSFVDYAGHDRAMRSGELVRVDVGCQLDQYMGDVGRTAPVGGRFSPGQREAWDVFIAGYLAGLAMVHDGVAGSDVYSAARQRIRALEPTLKTGAGKRAVTELLSPRGIEAWQFHNVGLDDAEGAPKILRAGMVVAYELMFALDGEGYYLEDMVLIEAAGYRMLTRGLPYTSFEIERAMAHRR